MSSSGKLNVEEQLALYRAHKKKEEDYKAKKKRFWDIISWIMSFGDSSTPSPSDSTRETSGVDSTSTELTDEDAQGQRTAGDNKEKEIRRRTGLSTESSSEMNTDHSDPQGISKPSILESYTTLDWIMLALKCIIWGLLFKVFILLEFGAVFFIFSAFVFIWCNMRSEPKKKGEISAYSVFNPNCEVIDGTFTAEQFERELLHKM